MTYQELQQKLQSAPPTIIALALQVALEKSTQKTIVTNSKSSLSKVAQ